LILSHVGPVTHSDCFDGTGLSSVDVLIDNCAIVDCRACRSSKASQARQVACTRSQMVMMMTIRCFNIAAILMRN
jgi:predicted DNA-binding helix-hairpin-helix protein